MKNIYVSQNVTKQCMQLFPPLFFKMLLNVNIIAKVCLSFMGLTLAKRMSLKVLHIFWYL